MLKRSLFAISLMASFCIADIVNIEISNAYAKATPPNAKNSAIFMDIKNNMNKPIKLIEVNSSVSNTSEIHTHKQSDGMMHMIQIDSIEIAPQATVNLKPGGLHLMLIDVKRPIKEGDMVDATLKFDNGMTIELDKIPAKHVMKQEHKH